MMAKDLLAIADRLKQLAAVEGDPVPGGVIEPDRPLPDPFHARAMRGKLAAEEPDGPLDPEEGEPAPA